MVKQLTTPTSPTYVLYSSYVLLVCIALDIGVDAILQYEGDQPDQRDSGLGYIIEHYD